ncbi:thioesterase family protein [Ignavibacterium sp.]|uniref:acyl-CoA thioesterase n=1 Tax=Ignavibacterium sp. TaxID=2651167 RepID=UPI00307CE9F9
MNTKDFNHKTTVQVRFHEVDMLGVCNNAVYINYFEHARLEYVKAAGLIPAGGIFSDGKLFFMVRNEINYRDHAFYDDELEIYSKVSYIKNSSFGFDHLIVKKKTGQIIVDGKGVVVYVDPKTRKSTSLPEDFIVKVKRIEPDVKIIRE